MHRSLSALFLVGLAACAPKGAPPAPPSRATYAARVHLLRHQAITEGESILGIPPLPGTRAHVAALEAELAAPADLTKAAAAGAGRGAAPGG